MNERLLNKLLTIFIKHTTVNNWTFAPWFTYNKPFQQYNPMHELANFSKDFGDRGMIPKALPKFIQSLKSNSSKLLNKVIKLTHIYMYAKWKLRTIGYYRNLTSQQMLNDTGILLALRIK